MQVRCDDTKQGKVCCYCSTCVSNFQGWATRLNNGLANGNIAYPCEYCLREAHSRRSTTCGLRTPMSLSRLHTCARQHRHHQKEVEIRAMLLVAFGKLNEAIVVGAIYGHPHLQFMPMATRWQCNGAGRLVALRCGTDFQPRRAACRGPVG